VGTHGRHGVDRVLLGSVSEALVRHGHLPLLVVPAHEEAQSGGS
ncbi:MAG TPA: universal stress protein, partial [Gammaproteobacteria bacterium]|nr:universal stress protein [Gammaproteobacteria bacterium]